MRYLLQAYVPTEMPVTRDMSRRLRLAVWYIGNPGGVIRKKVLKRKVRAFGERMNGGWVSE